MWDMPWWGVWRGSGSPWRVNLGSITSIIFSKDEFGIHVSSACYVIADHLPVHRTFHLGLRYCGSHGTVSKMSGVLFSHRFWPSCSKWFKFIIDKHVSVKFSNMIRNSWDVIKRWFCLLLLMINCLFPLSLQNKYFIISNESILQSDIFYIIEFLTYFQVVYLRHFFTIQRRRPLITISVTVPISFVFKGRIITFFTASVFSNGIWAILPVQNLSTNT